MPIANGIFIFNPPPRHFGWIVFAFLALYRPPDYIYKIWFSLVQRQAFSFFAPPHFGWLFFAFLALYRPPDYVYKIWLSLLQGQGFTFFSPHPLFWVVFGREFFKQKLSEMTSPTTLLMRQFAVELIV